MEAVPFVPVDHMLTHGIDHVVTGYLPLISIGYLLDINILGVSKTRRVITEGS